MPLFALARPILSVLPPEAAHRATIAALRLGLGGRVRRDDDAVLSTRVFGRDFRNPLGLAAGFDKHGEAMDAVLALGFGFVEVGTVTPRPQPGNPKPRVFRLPEDRAVINRLGFNSVGADVVRGRLEGWRRRHTGDRRPRGPVGVNLGRNKGSKRAAKDYAAGARHFAQLADYLVINVSSPNTPGLRALQGRKELETLLDAVAAVLPEDAPPVLLKIAPDLAAADREAIAEVALEGGVDGLVCTNTTVARPPTLRSRHRGEKGGLSGKPLMDLSTEVLADMYRLTGGGVPLVGVGGVASGADAYDKIRAGASLVQLYTALIYDGPALVGSIKRSLAALLRNDGFRSVAEAVGADHR